MGPVILGIHPNTLSPGELKLIVTIGAVPRDIVALCQARHLCYTLNPSGRSACVYGLQLDNISRDDRDIFQGLITGMMQARPATSGEYRITPPLPVSAGIKTPSDGALSLRE